MKTAPDTRVRIEVEPPLARSPVAASLLLDDGTMFHGRSFGYEGSTSGEVVFNTGMVGYPESLTDPSYAGQILVCTYPLIGNYGVTAPCDADGMDQFMESWKIHARGLIVCDYSEKYSHWNARRSLADWLKSEKIPAMTGVDTRTLTKRLRERGSMLGKLMIGGDDPARVAQYDPNRRNLAPEVSVSAPRLYKPVGAVRGRVAVIDCGCKHNILRSLVGRGLEVLRVPWDHDLSGEKIDGVSISNGPGDPIFYDKTVATVRRCVDKGIPTFGVCLGNQMLALAIGAKTFKLKYGHRGQNQPALEVGTNRAYMTSQNHGFAVDESTLPKGWSPWFTNLNDKTNEGIRHESGRFRSVQFHPEACPGPVDTAYLFEEFTASLK